METYRALRVLRADRGGSSWPVLIDTDAGVFHTKLRGAAQAPASLVAELIVGALADVPGLSVSVRVLIDIPPDEEPESVVVTRSVVADRPWGESRIPA